MSKRATILILDLGVTMYDGGKYLAALDVGRRVVESKIRWGGGEFMNVLVAGRAGTACNLLGLAGVWDSAHREEDAAGGDEGAAYNPYLRAPTLGDVAGLAPERFPAAGAAPTDLWRALGVALNNLEEAERIGGALLPLPGARRPGCVRVVIVSDFCGEVNAGAAPDRLRRCAGVLAEFGAQVDLVVVQEGGGAAAAAAAAAGDAAGGGEGGGGASGGIFGRSEDEEQRTYDQWEADAEMDDPGAPAAMGEGGGGGGGGGGASSSSSSAAAAAAAPAPAPAPAGGGVGELKSLQRLLMAAVGPASEAAPATVCAMLAQLLAGHPDVRGRAFPAAAALAAFSVRPAPAKASRFNTVLHIGGGAAAGGVTLPASLFVTSVAAKPPRVGTITEAAASAEGFFQGAGGGGRGGGGGGRGGGGGGGGAAREGYTVTHFQRIVPPPGMPGAVARALAEGCDAEAEAGGYEDEEEAAGGGGGGEGEDEGGGGGGEGGGGAGGDGGGFFYDDVGAPRAADAPALPEQLIVGPHRVQPAFRYGRSLVPVPAEAAGGGGGGGGGGGARNPLRSALLDRAEEPGGVHILHFSPLASLPRWALCGRPRWLLPAAAATGKKGDKGGGGAALSALVAAMAQRRAFAVVRVVGRRGANPALYAAIPALDAASAHLVAEAGGGGGGGAGAGAGAGVGGCRTADLLASLPGGGADDDDGAAAEGDDDVVMAA